MNALSALMIVLAHATFSQSPSPLPIAKAPASVIDGKLGEAEWKGTVAQELKGGGTLYLQHDGEFLYVAVHGTSHGWCHVYVIDDGTVFVHHASAALGTATYAKKGDLWQPEKKFAWELREQELSPSVEAKRATYLKANGWVANNMNMGTPGVLEFKIGRRFLRGDVVPIAVAFASDAASPQYWPSTLADDCLEQELLFGSSPADLTFDVTGWARITLQK